MEEGAPPPAAAGVAAGLGAADEGVAIEVLIVFSFSPVPQQSAAIRWARSKHRRVALQIQGSRPLRGWHPSPNDPPVSTQCSTKRETRYRLPPPRRPI